jgi:HD-GYP domain-containing protein (c-di-GMP phosphodiesterase class II)
MLTSFALALEMDMQRVFDIAFGALLHDIGKMRVSPEILNKPGPLSEDEFRLVKSHVVLGADLLRQMPGIPAVAFEPLEYHHERHDGSGYPRGLKGDEIPTIGRMAAIVDVYDAITSDRVYRKAIEPAAAIQKMFEWSRHHFDPELTQVFVRCIGIYPVGSLVLLESGRLGIVVEQHESNLLTPVVRVIFDSRRQYYLPPETLDLARPLGMGGGDRIVGYERASRWGIEIERFMPR